MATLDEIAAGVASGTALPSEDEVLLDFTEAVEGGKYENGTWPAVVSECYPDTSREGNPVLRWKYVFTDGPNKNREIQRSTPTTGKGAGISKKAIKALGFALEGDKASFKPSSAKGRACRLEITDQKNNSDFSEVHNVLAAQ